jgi:hypothetical protein
MAEHTGRCHCGAVQFRVSLDLDNLMTCNCSICGRTGSIMAFVPDAAFQLVAGQDAQTDYQFASKTIHHLFCSTCGVRSFANGKGPDGNAWTMVNVRCLDGVDVHALKIARQYDGRSR